MRFLESLGGAMLQAKCRQNLQMNWVKKRTDLSMFSTAVGVDRYFVNLMVNE
jgi:hypothetical protein